jgi:hypothetical protein
VVCSPSLAVALVAPPPARAQAKPQTLASVGESAGQYETLAEGAHIARIFATAAHRDLRIEVQDLILRAIQTEANIPVARIHVTELKPGEIETKVNGHAERRNPGDF